jgi:hypothetical protein
LRLLEEVRAVLREATLYLVERQALVRGHAEHRGDPLRGKRRRMPGRFASSATTRSHPRRLR